MEDVKQQEEMNKRFDDFILMLKEKDVELLYGLSNFQQNNIKGFIQSEISLAVAQERERIVKLIIEKGLHLGYANDIIRLINNN